VHGPKLWVIGGDLYTDVWSSPDGVTRTQLNGDAPLVRCIQSPEMIDAHPLRGALFENWAIMEAAKYRVHRGDMGPLYFWRDNIGTEVDLLLEEGTSLTGVEIKSGQTLASDMVRNLQAWQRHTAAGGARPGALVYGGSGGFQRWGVQVVGWRELAAIG
jgi:uncharacterized protein